MSSVHTGKYSDLSFSYRPHFVRSVLQNFGPNISRMDLATDDYAKDGGPGEIGLLCSFYHESLRSLILEKGQ